MTRTTLIAIVLSLPLVVGPEPEPTATPARLDTDREIFFAVLEGLYRDGVKNDVVDKLLSKNAAGAYLNFVAGCPLCIPALEAMRHYRQRPDFVSYKGVTNTWGSGLAKHERKALLSDDIKQRLEAMTGLVERWVSRRVEMRRLGPDERRRWENAMLSGRKKGMALLRIAKENGLMTEWGTIGDCAVCDGSNKPFGN